MELEFSTTNVEYCFNKNGIRFKGLRFALIDMSLLVLKDHLSSVCFTLSTLIVIVGFVSFHSLPFQISMNP